MIMGMTLQRVNDGLISGNDGLVLAFFYFFFFFPLCVTCTTPLNIQKDDLRLYGPSEMYSEAFRDASCKFQQDLTVQSARNCCQFKNYIY